MHTVRKPCDTQGGINVPWQPALALLRLRSPLHCALDQCLIPPGLPEDLIAVAVRWYVRFRLSLAAVVEWLAERGIVIDRSAVQLSPAVPTAVRRGGPPPPPAAHRLARVSTDDLAHRESVSAPLIQKKAPLGAACPLSCNRTGRNGSGTGEMEAFFAEDEDT